MSVTLADVLRRHGPAYVARHGPRLLPSHRRAIEAITACRTGALGGHLAHCSECGREHLLHHSCGHRACPRCGHNATSRWLARQRRRLLPVPYFHVVFTIPSELRDLVRTHQRDLLGVLFRAAYGALAALCADPRYLGAQVGALAVLHTWSRTLECHPHIHMLVTGGGLAPDGRTWRAARRRQRKDFLVPVHALRKGFRGRFLLAAQRALPHVTFPAAVRHKKWGVFAEAALDGHFENLIEYLGRYVHRTALTNKRILADDQRGVTFAYRDSRDDRPKTMTLPAMEFLRRFLQHVLPRGLHRVRSFGLLHPSKSLALRRLQLLLGAPPPDDPDKITVHPLTCPTCKTGVLRLVRRLSPSECANYPPPASSPPSALARAPPITPHALHGAA